MKKQKQRKRKPKLTLAKDSLRRMAAPELADVAGGAHTADNCPTVTFPKCCLTR